MTFFRGQDVTLKSDAMPWRVIETGFAPPWPCPQFGEVVRIAGMSLSYGRLFLRFEGFDLANFDAQEFEPVVKPQLPESLTALLKTDQREPALT